MENKIYKCIAWDGENNRFMATYDGEQWHEITAEQVKEFHDTYF